ncbi:PDZ domain [Trinorchestia longiramus]|nr:PDZ domain [Trinorchestia longiramus]
MDESLLREVVVTRSDDRGYGLTVSGESPVMVQDVKEGGPACLAGVQVGDCIMKVNGTPVSKFNHKEVVQIIKSSHSVRLTVCAGKSLPSAVDSQSPGDAAPGLHAAPAAALLRHHTKDKQHNKITAPLPVNNQLQNQFDVNRHKMLSKMLDTQLKTKESILLELEKKPNKALQKSLEKELETINNLVSTIQTKLKATEAENPLSQLHSSSSSNRRSPAVSRSSLHFVPSHPPSFHPYLPPQLLMQQQQSQGHAKPHHVGSQYRAQYSQDSHMPPPLPPQSRSQHNLVHHHHSQNKFLHRNPKQKHTRSASDIPPPLPARNRALLTQISEPNMAPISLVSIPNLTAFDSNNANNNTCTTDGGNNSNSGGGGNANLTVGDSVSDCGSSTSSSSTMVANLSDNLNATSGAQTSSKSSTTPHDFLSCSSISSASSSNPSSKASKSSSFKTPKGSTTLSASPSCVSTMSAPPNLCPPPLPPRPPSMGGPTRDAQALGGLHSVTSESSSNSSNSGGSRPPSQHCRAKSSPETITANPQARHEAFLGHLSGSDSLGDLASLHSSNSNHSNRSSSRVASTLMEDDPPPGTPPPPYANNNNNNNNASSTAAEEHDEEVDSTNASSCMAQPAGVASFASSSGGGGDHGGGGGDHGGGGGGALNSADDDEQDDDENYSTIPDEVNVLELLAICSCYGVLVNAAVFEVTCISVPTTLVII